MGSLYKRGKIWWIKYYYKNQPRYESTGKVDKFEASKILKAKEGDAVKHKLPDTDIEKVTFNDLFRK